MAPIMILHNSFPGVAYIEIFEPRLKDDDSILFFLKLNQKAASIELRQNNTWITHGINGNFPHRVIAFIQEKIEDRYFN